MENSNTQRDIGKIEAKVETITNTIKEMRDEAKEDREVFRKEIADTKQSTLDNKDTLAQVMIKLNKALESAENVNKWQERFNGMKMLINFFWMVFGATILWGIKLLYLKFFGA
jgi:t-SNARE complex subunit (syntaxin)